jgi:hypothetical protein
MEHYTNPEKSFKPVHVSELPLAGDWWYTYFNRQSDTSNAYGNERYVPMLAKEHARLSPNAPFNPHLFIASGDIKILRNAFSSGDIEAALAGTYFEQLAHALKCELQKATVQKLCVIFPSIDRIFRPAGYDPKGGTPTWNYCEEDYAIFQKFLDHFFRERAVDIQFALLDDSPPTITRSNAIKSGQRHTGNFGGRPKKHNPTIDTKVESLRLAEAHAWNAARIRRYFRNQYKMNIPIRTIQFWLKDAGLQSRVGRPRGKKNAQS